MKAKVFLFILIPILLYGTTNIDSLKMELKNLDNEDKYQSLNEIVQYYLQRNPDSSFYYVNMKLNLAKSFLDSHRIGNSYLDLANTFSMMNKYDLAFKNVENAQTIFFNLKDSLGIADCNLNIGYYYYYLNKFELSSEFLKNAIELYHTLNYQGRLSQSYLYLSNVDMAFANYNNALENAFKSLHFACEFGSKRLNANVNILISDIYLILENYERAKNYIFLACEYASMDAFFWEQAHASYKLGYIYLHFGIIDSAKFYILKAQEFFKNSKNLRGELSVNTYYSKILKTEGKYRESLELLNRSLELSRESNFPWMISEISQQLGELYLTEKKYGKALDHILNGLMLAKTIKAKDLVLNNYQSLSKYYEKTGNYRKAFEIHKKYADLKDSLFIKNQNDITDLQIDYFTKRIKEENELLQKDLSISQLESEKQKLLTTLFLSGLLAVLFISLAIFYLYRRKKNYNIILQDKIKSALEAQREQQQIIVHQAGLNSLGEFSAGITHQLSQPLQNIILSIQQLELNLKKKYCQDHISDQNFKEIYEDMHRIQHTIDHIRLFSSRQQEDYSELFSVNESLNNAYRLVKKQYDRLNITIDLDLSSELPDLSGNPFQLEQVVLNLLSNAKDAVEDQQNRIQNGYVKKIKLQTYAIKNQIILEISDNGSGIPLEAQSKIFFPFFTTKKLGEGQGLGLSIANNIIQDLGGYIEVFSEFEHGTEVKVFLPVNGKTSHNFDTGRHFKQK